MRDFQRPGRSPVHGLKGAVATSHPLASVTAIDVLKSGGNAVDAAVAACAVLGVVEPQSTGIGGDCFALYAPGGRVPPIAINGSGPAPAAATVDKMKSLGLSEIGFQSPHAVTVPGAVATWSKLLQDHGTKGLDELLQPAIGYAADGFVVHSRIAFDWARNAEKLAACPNAKRIFLPGGAAPAAGTVHRQPELAHSLRLIAKEGREAFYRGEIAEDILAYLGGIGNLLSAGDLADFDAQYVEPIRTNYRGYDVYECPPNGQGIIALIILNILQGFDLAGLDPISADRLHLEAEAARLAYRDRNALIADPDKTDVPATKLLSMAYADALRKNIATNKAMASMPPPGLPDHRDTVYLTVVDGSGNAISFINSTFHNFGSGLCTPKTGVMLQNRGSSFNLDADHPNCIAPGKRPMHTIIPGMLAQGDRAVMPFGVMGGHFQAIGHAHLLTNIIDYGMDVQTALDYPRAFHVDNVFQLETTFGSETAERLSAMGHTVARTPIPHGGGQAIWIDQTSGVLTGGSDPRKDGCALAY